jgi:hypothetical protein
MSRIGARCHFEEHENEVQATSNTGFLRKRVKSQCPRFRCARGTNFASLTKITATVELDPNYCYPAVYYTLLYSQIHEGN